MGSGNKKKLTHMATLNIWRHRDEPPGRPQTHRDGTGTKKKIARASREKHVSKLPARALRENTYAKKIARASRE